MGRMWHRKYLSAQRDAWHLVQKGRTTIPLGNTTAKLVLTRDGDDLVSAIHDGSQTVRTERHADGHAILVAEVGEYTDASEVVLAWITAQREALVTEIDPNTVQLKR